MGLPKEWTTAGFRECDCCAPSDDFYRNSRVSVQDFSAKMAVMMKAYLNSRKQHLDIITPFASPAVCTLVRLAEQITLTVEARAINRIAKEYSVFTGVRIVHFNLCYALSHFDLQKSHHLRRNIEQSAAALSSLAQGQYVIIFQYIQSLHRFIIPPVPDSKLQHQAHWRTKDGPRDRHK